MLQLLQAIISILGDIWLKIRKLNAYWSTNHSLTVTTTNGSGYTVTAKQVNVVGNVVRITVTYKISANKSAGSIKGKICHFTVTGMQNICNGSFPLAVNGLNGATGPLATGCIINSTKTDDDTWDFDVYLNGVAGGTMSAKKDSTDIEYAMYFYTQLGRSIPIS